MTLTHTVTPQEDGMTLQALLRGPMALSARQARETKATLTVDGAPFFANQRVRTGMLVRLTLSGYAGAARPGTKEVPLRVLYEDDALLAVYKESLLQCHPSPSAPNGSDTLEARVQRYLHAPAHPVHRLDAETTGIVLFAKLPFAQARLQQQMQAGEFQKTYEAWVFGVPDPAHGEIDAPIARVTPNSFTRVVRANGQRAVSRYETLRTAPLPGGKATLLALSPLTGRTHQLRVHMAHIGHPLLGDTRYASPESAAVSDALGLTHHQLAAVALRFVHPFSGQPVALSCPARFDFRPPAGR